MPNSYDSAWNKWPVKHGEVWRVANHLIACGDLEQRAFEAFTLAYGEGKRPDMTFVDPPWTPALATGYRTKAGVPAKVDFEGLMQWVGHAAAWAEGAIYIEIGRQYQGAAISTLESLGIPHAASWDITYYRTRPARLLLFHRIGATNGSAVTADFTGYDDEDVPALAIQTDSRYGGIVFDPCTGQGLTAESAALAGRRFMGIELHPGRMARALDRLSAVEGESPSRVGYL
jgi:hypothetical protein